MSQHEKKKLKRYETAGFIFTSIAATILHFLYDWSGQELFTALFSAINESVWEHIKIFTLPYAVWGFVEVFCTDIPFKKIASAKVFGLYSLALMMPVFYYTYTGVIGKSITIVDILSGYVITALAYVISYRLITNTPYIERYFHLCAILFLLYCAAIAFFTFAPPDLAIFTPPGVHPGGQVPLWFDI